MESTDLELIIRQLENQLKELVRVKDAYKNEPEADYAGKSMSSVYDSLSILRSFKENHSEIAKKEKELIRMRQRIASLAKVMVQQIMQPEKYKRSFPRTYNNANATIEFYLTKVKALQMQINKLESDMESIQYDGKEGSKSDFIYENIEAMYDGLLDSFQIKFSYHKRQGDYYLEISRSTNLISISVLRSSVETKKYGRNEFFFRQLADIGFKKKDEFWKFQFNVETEDFERLITTVARVLIEAFRATNQVVTVIFNDK